MAVAVDNVADGWGTVSLRKGGKDLGIGDATKTRRVEKNEKNSNSDLFYSLLSGYKTPSAVLRSSIYSLPFNARESLNLRCSISAEQF